MAAMDTPAKIAVLGAGPIGIETALYARFLGYDVVLFERGEVAEHVRQWGHVQMFTPWSMNCSSLGLAALYAQNDDFEPPADDALITGRQWVRRYLEPLSKTDLLHGNIKTQTEVLRVGRNSYLKMQNPGDSVRGEDAFQILYRDSSGEEQREEADVVIDCTGVFGQPNWIGPGGVPAIGELRLRNQILYRVPDADNGDREQFAGKRTMVIGAGYSAATSVVNLSRLAEETGGEVVWLTRREDSTVVRRIDNDRLPLRDTLATQANALVEQGRVQRLAGFWVDRIEEDEGSLRLHVIRRRPQGSDEPLDESVDDEESAELEAESDEENETRIEVVDRIVANVGYRGDASITEDLQVHRCYATDGPIQLASKLMNAESNDCLDQVAAGPELLVCPEPNFYLLGAKVFGRNSNFLYRNGLDQIRDLFSLIGERSTLDLYASAKTLPS